MVLFWNTVIILNLQQTKGVTMHKGSKRSQQTEAAKEGIKKRRAEKQVGSKDKEGNRVRRNEGYPISR